MADKAEVLLLSLKKTVEDGLEKSFVLHSGQRRPRRVLDKIARVCAPCIGRRPCAGRRALMSRLPKLEIVSSFGSATTTWMPGGRASTVSR